MIKIETTGDFMLIDPDSGIEIAESGETEVPQITNFLQSRIDAGQVRVMGGEAAAEAPKPQEPTAPSASSPAKRKGKGK